MKLLNGAIIVILLVILYYSWTPQVGLPVSNDKLGHFIAYGTLSFAMTITYFKSKHFVNSIVFSAGYGLVMEVGQYFIPGRTFSFLDILANFSGVLLGVVFAWMVYSPIQKVLSNLNIIKRQ